MIGFTAAVLIESSSGGMGVAEQLAGYREWLTANS
jgi:hypothetical protein